VPREGKPRSFERGDEGSSLGALPRPDGRTALVYNPGLHVLGGGERYTFALARALAREYRVRLAGTSVPSTGELRRRGFPTDLDTFTLPYRDYPGESAGYDLSVAVAIFPPSYPSRARRSYLQVSFPFRAPLGVRHPRAGFRERRALRSYDGLVANSEYTREWIARRWKLPSEVVYPPADLGAYDPGRKLPVVLSLARFIPEKGQTVLVDAFVSLPRELRESWTLVLAGGSTDSPPERDHLERLRERAQGHNVDLRVNAPQSEVVELLDTASLFWHAAGYGRPRDRPQDAEHFGISIVEAMSRGAVPLVYADGGALEIVHAAAGATWTTPAELAQHAIVLMTESARRDDLARASAEEARRFGTDEFERAVRELMG